MAFAVNDQFANAGIRYAGGVSEFGELLKSAVKTAGFENVKAFAKAVRYAQSNMSRIASDLRPPPIKRMGAWADRLQLKGTARDAFLEAAQRQYEDHRTRGADDIRERAEKLRSQAIKDREEIIELRAQLAKVVAYLKAKNLGLPDGLGDV